MKNLGRSYENLKKFWKSGPCIRCEFRFPPTDSMQPSPNYFGQLLRCVGEKLVAGSTHMSAIAPTELRIDSVCCVGLSSHGTLLLHNPTIHWMRVKLSVAQISIDGQPADQCISPFVVRPKVTIDPNSTESVKVVSLFWIMSFFSFSYLHDYRWRLKMR